MKHKILSYIMSFLMIFSLFTENTMTVEAASDLSQYISSTESYLAVGGQTIAPGEPIELDHTTSVELYLKWNFVDGQEPTSTNDVFTYTLPQEIAFNDQTDVPLTRNDGAVDGYATISGNQVTVRYTREEFFTEGDRFSTLRIFGSLIEQSGQEGEANKYTFTIPGVGNYDFTVKPLDTSSLSILKSGGQLNEDTMTAQFNLEITATGNPKNVVINDNNTTTGNGSGGYLSYAGDLKWYTDAAHTKEFTEGTITPTDNRGFTYTLSDMSNVPVNDQGQKKLYGVYTMNVDEKIFALDPASALNGQNIFRNVAIITSDNAGGNTSNAAVQFNKKTWAEKNHTVEGDVITWKIVLNKDKLNLANTRIKDTLGEGLEYVEGSFDVDPKLSGLTFESLTTGNGYRFDSNTENRNTYTITYKTRVTDGDGRYDKTNTISVIPNNEEWKKIDVTDTAGVVIGDNYIDKEVLTENGAYKDVDWKLTVHAPKDGINHLKVVDQLPEGMSYTEDSLDVSGTKVTYDVKYDTENNQLIVTFDGKVDEGDIELTFTTHIDGTPVETTDYTNTGTVFGENETELGKDDATYTYTPKEYLRKVYVSQNAGNPAITYWRLLISKVGNDVNSVVVTEKLPDKFEYPEGEREAFNLLKMQDGTVLNQYLNAKDDVNVNYDKANKTVTFEFTGKALEYIKENDLCLNVRLDMTNPMDFIGSSSERHPVTNTANIKIDDVQYNDVSATANLRVPENKILDKTGVYDATTAPDINYTITVNPNGKDLNPEGDTLELTDKMSNNLYYRFSSLKINGKSPDASNNAKYDEETHTLTFTVPDGEKVVIEYTAMLNMNPGIELNEDDASNSVTLKGVGYKDITSEESFTGKVLDSQGSSGGDNVSIQVYKYGEDAISDPLNGAKFKLTRMSVDKDGNATDIDTTKTAVTKNENGSGDGFATFGGLYRDTLYKIEETDAPEGYILDSTPKFVFFVQNETIPETITYNNQTYSVNKSNGFTYILNFKNELPVSLKIEKTGESNDLLSGAKFKLERVGYSIDANGNMTTLKVVETKTGITKDGFLSFDNLQVKQLYRLTETNAPKGYETDSKPRYFIYQESGSTQTYTSVDENSENLTVVSPGEGTSREYTYTMKNTYEKKTVKINKVDENGDAIEGANLEIFQEDGTSSTGITFTSTKEAKEVDLKPGTYVLRETSVPTGYKVAKDIKFTIGESGKVTYEGKAEEEAADRITMVDDYETYKVIINKVDEKGKALPGAELSVLDKNLGALDPEIHFESNENGYEVSLKPGEYVGALKLDGVS